MTGLTIGLPSSSSSARGIHQQNWKYGRLSSIITKRAVSTVCLQFAPCECTASKPKGFFIAYCGDHWALGTNQSNAPHSKTVEPAKITSADSARLAIATTVTMGKEDVRTKITICRADNSWRRKSDRIADLLWQHRPGRYRRRQTYKPRTFHLRPGLCINR